MTGLALQYAAFSLALTYALWLFYLAVMNLRRARLAGTLSRTAVWFGTPVLLVGLALDVACNVLVLTVFMWDWPRETLVTYRLKRYAAGPDGWRRRVALWFADDLLDDFDPSGKHV